MENLPQWVLDLNIEVETAEEKEVVEVQTEFEAGLLEVEAKVEAEKKWQAEKRKGLTHKPFKALKAA